MSHCKHCSELADEYRQQVRTLTLERAFAQANHAGFCPEMGEWKRRAERAEADLARVRQALDSEYLEPGDKLVVIRRALSGTADKLGPQE